MTNDDMRYSIPDPVMNTLADQRICWSAELRTVAMVAQRDLLRLFRARGRLLGSFILPLSFLLILGVGLNRLINPAGDAGFMQFMLPGVVAMQVITVGLQNGASVVWDREFGFMREMLVAPPHRLSIIAGKIAGSTLVATLVGTIILLLAPLLGVRLNIAVITAAIGVATLLAMTLTAFGVFLASWIQRLESFQAITALTMMPLMFLSGALFPLRGLPGWLTIASHINPLSYGVDALRQVVLTQHAVDPASRGRFTAGIEIAGYTLPIALELLIVAGAGILCAGLATLRFGKPD